MQPCQQHFRVTEEEEGSCDAFLQSSSTLLHLPGSAVCQPSTSRPLWQDSQSCDTPDVPLSHYADVKPSPRQSHALLPANSPSHHDFKHLTLIELFIVLSVSLKLFRVVWNLPRNELQTCPDASEATRAVLYATPAANTNCTFWWINTFYVFLLLSSICYISASFETGICYFFLFLVSSHFTWNHFTCFIFV